MRGKRGVAVTDTVREKQRGQTKGAKKNKKRRKKETIKPKRQ